MYEIISTINDALVATQYTNTATSEVIIYIFYIMYPVINITINILIFLILLLLYIVIIYYDYYYYSYYYYVCNYFYYN